MPATQAADRRRQRARDDTNPDDHRVLSFRQWCELNGFSESTGRRIISRGEVTVTQLSPRRIGITIGNNSAWQASRARAEV
jgi:predicted DNA-binding transcriptional regulator AlpA